MTTHTIFADWATYQGTAPGWWDLQNPWNNGSLVNGTDYTQTLTANSSTFPDGTVISWNWGSHINSDNVWGYPEVVYGAQAGIWQSADGQGPQPIQIKNLTALTGTYNVSIGGSTDNFDVLWETQLTSAPFSGQEVEFSIMPHSPSYDTQYITSLPDQYQYNEAGLSATIAVTSNGSYPYVIVLPNQGDMLSGTVDIKSILDFLTAKGVLTGNEYIQGFEMGAEPQTGSGSLTINKIGYDWNGTIVGDGVAPTSSPTPTPTPVAAPTPTPTTTTLPTTTPTPPPTPTLNTLDIGISEDAWKGNAQFTVSVDGKQVGGTLTAHVLHSTGDSGHILLTGSFGTGSHDVKISFINDAWGGTPSTDRNLYVNSVSLDGTTYGQPTTMLSNGSQDFMVGGSNPSVAAAPDKLVLHMSEDAWQGDAKFTVSVDGKVLDTPEFVTALRSAGASEDFIYTGNFGAGSHNVAVKFLNDAYGGTPTTDRNLYVNGLSFDSNTYTGAALMGNGSHTFHVSS